MKPFIHDDFLLETDSAAELYHDYAEQMPIIDYHCHLSPEIIAEDHGFSSITEMWLHGDHYKWRAMRANGIDEKYITGNGTDKEKFSAWAETVPYTIRNPLYHWTHLELKRYFGIDELLTKKTAQDIYETCNDIIHNEHYCPSVIFRKMNVESVCTTDDPVDSLDHHKKYNEKTRSTDSTRLYPAWRPDRALAADNPRNFNEWLDKLEYRTGRRITTLNDFMEALKTRHDFFHEMGCRISDHGLERFYSEEFREDETGVIFEKARSGATLNSDEVNNFKSAMIHRFCIMDHSRGWVQQFHVGVVRNINSRLYETMGPDTGFDSIGDGEMARPLAGMLDRLDRTRQLAKTILYNINPADFEVFAAMAGGFQDGTVPGKIQLGSGWWFLDQKDGMEAQMNALSNMGLLARFIGMTTDSRSFLSYPRHEYFRRILCNMIGRDIRRGLLPDDMPWMGKIVQDICYYNAKSYFNLE